MTDVQVYFDEELVGYLSLGEGIRPVVEFRYDQSWLGGPQAFGIDPELPLSSAPFTRTGSLFGAFRDAAPDEWGRGLLARSTPDRFLGESDYLLGVSDETRQGALRFRDAGGRWMTEQSKVPVLMDLPKLRAAVQKSESDAKAPVRELAAAGAGTGGARPKVIVSIDSELWIAKFGRRGDEIQVESAEHVIANLARRAGVEMSDTALELDGAEPILLTRRFDRVGRRRLGYLSALSVLEHEVGPGRAGVYDYLELADVLPLWSSRPTQDLHQLWRRIAFGVVVRNTDDHMRNHAFIRDPGGWRLSPAFDLNTEVRSWVPFVTAVDNEVGAGRLEALLATIEYFRMTLADGRAVLEEVCVAADAIGDLLVEKMAKSTSERLVELVSDGVRDVRKLLA